MGRRPITQIGYAKGMTAEPIEPGAEVLVELDARRRVSLGRLGHHDRYLGHEEVDGTIVLVPAVVISELQARFLASPETAQRVTDALNTPESWVRRGRPARKVAGG